MATHSSILAWKNLMDRGAWWTTVHGVTKRWTSLKQLSTYAYVYEHTVYFLGSKITADGDCSHEIKRRLLLGRKAMTNLDSIKQGHYFANKGLSSQCYGFCSSHVPMWELDCKESWAPKTWCFWTVVLEKTLESPLDCKESQPVQAIGDQSWVFIGRTEVETETGVLWPPDAKSRFIGKDPDDGKDWRQEEKGTTEDEMVGWHHQLDGHGFGWTLAVCDGQGGLACSSSWGHRVGHDCVTELNWTGEIARHYFCVLEIMNISMT